MPTKDQHGGRPRLEQAWPVRVRNTTGEQVPPYGCMQVTGATAYNGEESYNVIKPNGSQDASFIINGPVAILANGWGSGTITGPMLVAYDVSWLPILNDEWGPIAGSWAISANGKGYKIIGGASGGIVSGTNAGQLRVMPKNGAAAGDDFPLVKIHNVSGLSRPFGTVSGYGAPVDPPPGTLHRIPTFKSAPPQPGKPFVVLLADSTNNAIVDAAPCGVVAVQINFTDAAHTHADAITNDFSRLASAPSGPALIIWRELQGVAGGGTLGLQWARVRLDPVAMTTDPRGVIEQQITAASGTRSGPNLTPGTGIVRLYVMPQSGAIGTPWAKGTTVNVETWMHATSDIGKPVILRESRKAPDGTTIYLAIAEGCQEVPS